MVGKERFPGHILKLGVFVLFCITVSGTKFKCYKKEKVGWEPAAAIESLLKYHGSEVSQEQIIKKVEGKKRVYIYKVMSFIEEKGLEPISFKGSTEVIDMILEKGKPVLLLQWASKGLKKPYFRVVTKRKKDKYYLCEPCAGKPIKLKRKKLEQLWKGGKNWALIIKRPDEESVVRKDEYYYRDKALLAIYSGDLERAKKFLKKTSNPSEEALRCLKGKDSKCLNEILQNSLYAIGLDKKEEDDFISLFITLFIAAIN